MRLRFEVWNIALRGFRLARFKIGARSLSKMSSIYGTVRLVHVLSLVRTVGTARLVHFVRLVRYGWYGWYRTNRTNRTVPTVPYQAHQPYQAYRTKCTNRTKPTVEAPILDLDKLPVLFRRAGKFYFAHFRTWLKDLAESK